MRAVKFWYQASQDEKQRSGNPPDELVKESIYFTDESFVTFFETNGYQVMSDEQFDAYIQAHQSLFESYTASSYSELVSFNTAFQLNEDKIRKGREFLLSFKLKNLRDGINWSQSVWLHSRVKNWVVNVKDVGPIEVDLYNVINSGDLESAIYMLMSGSADDMTKPYHWVTQERINWCINELTNLLNS